MTKASSFQARIASCAAPATASGRSSDALHFLQEFCRDPRNIAAILPSGRALASLITRQIDGATGPVLELGAGTGVFTQALLDRGVDGSALTLVEREASFARLLRQRYPEATVVCTDAAHLHDLPPGSFGAVVCGLGLLNLTASQVEAILRATFASLRPDGAFFLFTYRRHCSVPPDMLERLDLVATRVGGTFRNIPPASVHRIERRARQA